MQADVARRGPAHKGMMGTPDLFRQFLDIAAGKLRSDAGLTSILQLDLDSVKVNHCVPLSWVTNLGLVKFRVS
jgi:hypothetical protein